MPSSVARPSTCNSSNNGNNFRAPSMYDVVNTTVQVTAAKEALVRRWTRRPVSSTPPPLPLISLPPEDEWEQFNVPTRTGFSYSLPDLALEEEEPTDASAISAPLASAWASTALATRSAAPPASDIVHDRRKICWMLKEYMTQNEMHQARRSSFGAERRLVYKRIKSAVTNAPTNSKTNKRGAGVETNPRDESNATCDDGGNDDDEGDDLRFDAFFESGNLECAHRVVGRQYASTDELLAAGRSEGGGGGGNSSGSFASASSPPFPFFVNVDQEYDLMCDKDISTNGHIQWYFFRVDVPSACFRRTTTTAASHANVLRVRFNIRNMLKKDSLYNEGMLPAVYIDGYRGWHHAGTNVCYFQNASTYRNHKSGKMEKFYTLSFVYEFTWPIVTPLTKSSSDSNTTSNSTVPTTGPATPDQMTDTVHAGAGELPKVLRYYFAHCYPYSYSRVKRLLTSMQKDPERNRFFRRRALCTTIAGNTCDVLTITDFSHDDETRTAILLTARVHPGESNSSFIMHGILDFLTGPTLEARYLRHRFVFKVVPMLNPDGVIHGNYRCSLAGTDLNRRYQEPSPKLHPTVFATKNLLISTQQTRRVSLYCDIHGHSRRRNVFLYGCRPYDDTDSKDAKSPTGSADTGDNSAVGSAATTSSSLRNARAEAARVRLFPHVLCQTSNASAGGFFSFSDCSFSVSKSKRGTGRVVGWADARVLHSYTLEASFFGVGLNQRSSRAAPLPPCSTSLENAITHFMPSDLRQAGVQFCLSLIPFAHLLNLDRPLPVSPLPSAALSPGRRVSEPSGTVSAISAEVTPLISLTPHLQAVPGSPNGSCSNRAGTRTGTTNPTNQASEAFTNADTKILLSPRSRETGLQQKVRLAPLSRPQHAAALPSTEFSSGKLHTGVTLVSPHSSPRQRPPAVDVLNGSVEATDAFDFTALLSSLVNTEDLLKEIEDTLPDNVQDCDQEEDESPGSESDPSGDNMETDELARQPSWKDIAAAAKPEPVKLPESSPHPTLKKSRSQMLYKRFSESQLRRAAMSNKQSDAIPLDVPRDAGITHPTVRVTAMTPPHGEIDTSSWLAKEPKNEAPGTTLAPVRDPLIGKPALVRPKTSNSALKDRNRDIAAMHRLAVQKRTRHRRVRQGSVIIEE